MSEAKLKARSEDSRQKVKFDIFWREALLHAFSFATLSQLSGIFVSGPINYEKRHGAS